MCVFVLRLPRSAHQDSMSIVAFRSLTIAGSQQHVAVIQSKEIGESRRGARWGGGRGGVGGEVRRWARWGGGRDGEGGGVRFARRKGEKKNQVERKRGRLIKQVWR